MADPILQAEALTMRFGGLTAVDAVTFTAMRGEITAIIGPNGAGKTTVFNCITGFYRPTEGRLRLFRDGAPVELQALAGHRIAQAGVARTFQNIRLFPGMTALENLLVAQHNTLMAATGFGIGALLLLAPLLLLPWKRFASGAAHVVRSAAAGLPAPFACKGGVCATCRAKVTAGEVRMKANYGLSEQEVADGYVLTCQMHPKSDCVVNIPASSEVCKIKHATLTASVAEVRQLSPSTLSLVLQGEGIGKLAFLPGQYANLEVPGTTQHRAYSFSSMPAEGKVSFLIRNVPNGLMSGYLTGAAKAGDTIKLAGPIGSFYLRDVARPVLMLAGGTGLAPFLAMLDKLVAAGGSAHPIHLIYGVNTDADVVELERLDAFKAALPNFTYDVCVVADDSSWPKKGYVTAHIEPTHLNEGNVDIYLCGPPPMREAVAHDLRERKVQPNSFHYEKFAASV